MLHAGTDGKAKITLQGRGVPLDTPDLPVTHLPVTVQLVNSAGECWGATYNTTFRNQDDQLKARAD